MNICKGMVAYLKQQGANQAEKVAGVLPENHRLASLWEGSEPSKRELEIGARLTVLSTSLPALLKNTVVLKEPRGSTQSEEGLETACSTSL